MLSNFMGVIMLKSTYTRAALALAAVGFYAGEAAAQLAKWRGSEQPTSPASSAPEIDGPAGIAAVALLVSAGIIAYNRFKK